MYIVKRRSCWFPAAQLTISPAHPRGFPPIKGTAAGLHRDRWRQDWVARATTFSGNTFLRNVNLKSREILFSTISKCLFFQPMVAIVYKKTKLCTEHTFWVVLALAPRAFVQQRPKTLMGNVVRGCKWTSVIDRYVSYNGKIAVWR